MDEDKQNDSDIFDGNQFTPQFALVLNNFLSARFKSAAGTALVTANTTSYAVAHGLGRKPTGASCSSYPIITAGVAGNVSLNYTTPYDATYIYLTNDDASHAIYAVWAAWVI